MILAQLPFRGGCEVSHEKILTTGLESSSGAWSAAVSTWSANHLYNTFRRSSQAHVRQVRTLEFFKALRFYR